MIKSNSDYYNYFIAMPICIYYGIRIIRNNLSVFFSVFYILLTLKQFQRELE